MKISDSDEVSTEEMLWRGEENIKERQRAKEDEISKVKWRDTIEK